MTNETEAFTDDERGALLDAYRTLTGVADTTGIPAIRAALRSALAELRTALDGQGVDLPDYYRTTSAREPAA